MNDTTPSWLLLATRLTAELQGANHRTVRILARVNEALATGEIRRADLPKLAANLESALRPTIERLAMIRKWRGSADGAAK